jgi:propionate catabolism operon transcriptional regulator
MIGVLAAYREIEDIVADLRSEIPDEIEVLPCRVTDALKVSHHLVSRGATVLLSRGGTTNYLKGEQPDWLAGVPIVDIPVTAYDVIRAIGQAREMAGRVSVIAFPSMIEGIDDVTEFLGVDVTVTPIANDFDVGQEIRHQASGKDVCFVGGAITHEIAQDSRYPSVLIRSGRAAVAYALREASRIARVQQLEREKHQRLHAVLDSMEDGVILVDAAGAPELWNSRAEAMLQAHNVTRGRDLIKIKALEEAILKSLRDGMATDAVIRLPSGAQVVASVSPVSSQKSSAPGVLVSLRDAVRVEALEQQVRSNLHSLGHVAKKRLSDIIGSSEMLRRTVATAQAFAAVDATVLILGESGTGKEVYAQAIHNASARRNGPYVALNCAALPEALLESELFGYVGGAFTGATKEGKPGLFEMAHRGTLLLDEISELSPRLQGKLLRVLQERQVRRVGGERVIPIDVRVLAASNRDLVGMVRKGEFREDLFFRLDVLRINIPPLRERPEDVEALFPHFVCRFSRELKLPPVELSADAIRYLSEYTWPGNVREVQNVVQRCLAMYAGQTLTPEKIDRVLRPDRRYASNDDTSSGASLCGKNGTSPVNGRKDITVRDIEEAVLRSGGSMTKAARMLGVHRSTLWRHLKRLNS